MSMLEADCTRCKELFVPHGVEPGDLIHGETEAGDDCGGIGVILGEWTPPTGQTLYDFEKFKNLTRQELHGVENPNCSDPDCEFHHPEVVES